jgi:hypothetical protein
VVADIAERGQREFLRCEGVGRVGRLRHSGRAVTGWWLSMSSLSFADRARRRTLEAGPLTEALRTPGNSGATAADGQFRSLALRGEPTAQESLADTS